MSQMLDQAVVDAEALRDAAYKKAEDALIEKFNPQIKQAVELMLEQEEGEEELADMFGGGGMGADMGAGEVTGVADDMPLAATDGEKLCPCPESEEEIEIDFDTLEKQMRAEEEADQMDHEDLAGNLGIEEPEDEFELDEDLLSSMLQESEKDSEVDEAVKLSPEYLQARKGKAKKDSKIKLPPEYMQAKKDREKKKKDSESAEKTEADKKELEEGERDLSAATAMRKDAERAAERAKKDRNREPTYVEIPVPKGPPGHPDRRQFRREPEDEDDGNWLGLGKVDLPEPLEEEEGAKPDYLDLDGDGDKKEPMKKAAKDKKAKKSQNESLSLEARIQKAVLSETKRVESSLLKENKALLSEKQTLIKENKNLKESVEQVQEKFLKLSEALNDTNLTNAKLLYTNEVLKSNSLNERQKDKIVEAISRTGSVDEAKTVYETMKTSVGTTMDRGSKSIDDILAPKRTMFENRQRKTEVNPVSSRWQRLAGIEKK